MKGDGGSDRMFETALLLYLCQELPANRLPPEMRQQWPESWSVEDTGSVSSSVLKREADDEDAQFAKRFNALAAALTDFASNYNSAHTIDVKKVRAVEKAWRE